MVYLLVICSICSLLILSYIRCTVCMLGHTEAASGPDVPTEWGAVGSLCRLGDAL